MAHLHRTSDRRHFVKARSYAAGAAGIDAERARSYERLATLHDGTDLGNRYRQRALECWRRIDGLARGEPVDVAALIDELYQDDLAPG